MTKLLQSVLVGFAAFLTAVTVVGQTTPANQTVIANGAVLPTSVQGNSNVMSRTSIVL